jgi:acyl carrier protein
MTRAEIFSSLLALLKKQKQITYDVTTVTEDTRIDAMGFDSLSILDFIYDVEGELKVTTQIADLVRMERVKDLIDYLERQLAG